MAGTFMSGTAKNGSTPAKFEGRRASLVQKDHGGQRARPDRLALLARKDLKVFGDRKAQRAIAVSAARRVFKVPRVRKVIKAIEATV